MATIHKGLSNYELDKDPDNKNLRIGIVVSEWNHEITKALASAAQSVLLEHGVKRENLYISNVPGSFELPLGAQLLIESYKPDAVILLGCVIQGETRHFDFICQAVAQGCMNLGLKYDIPAVFGVLTTNTMEQAMDRAGGKYGNKGIEAAVTALKMVTLKKG